MQQENLCSGAEGGWPACSTLIVYRGYTDQIDDRIIKVCSAMELYRHSILIHDDIVDAEEQRRGGDTLHKTLGKGFDDRFGVGSALFAGNILYAKALESVLESGFDQKMLAGCPKTISNGVQGCKREPDS